MHRILIGLLQAICARLASIPAPIRRYPFPPFSPLVPPPVIATPNPATIDAMTLCEVTNLTNPAPIHRRILPAFQHDHAPHSRRSDPIPSYIIQRRSRHTITTPPHSSGRRDTIYYQRTAKHRHTLAGKESLCGQELDGGRG